MSVWERCDFRGASFAEAWLPQTYLISCRLDKTEFRDAIVNDGTCVQTPEGDLLHWSDLGYAREPGIVSVPYGQLYRLRTL